MSIDHSPPRLLLGRPGLSALIDALQEAELTVIGPTVHDGVIDYEEISDVTDLPWGWSDTQAPGAYRLEQRVDDAVFQFASTAQSWKRLLHPPVQTVLTAYRTTDGLRFVPASRDTRRVALLGVRSCDLRAIHILEKALTADPEVKARRERAFIVAVHCGRSASTCFCTSMGTGPRADTGFDLALTELLDSPHRFLVEIGSARGARILETIDTRLASDDDLRAAHEATEVAARQQDGRHFDPDQARHALLANVTSDHWGRGR